VHAFTVATNALLTGNGARVALITTRGFRDVLEIARLRMPQLYNMDWDKPKPLVPRRLRFEIEERMGGDGAVVLPLTPPVWSLPWKRCGDRRWIQWGSACCTPMPIPPMSAR
jgi:hypothetical protein